MFWCSESLDFYIKPYPVSVILCFIKSRCGLCCFVVLLMTRDWFINWINWWGAYWLPGTAVDTWDTAVNERAKSAWPHQAYILVWETDNEHYCITQIRQKAVFLRGQEGGRWLSKQYIRVTPEQPDGDERVCAHLQEWAAAAVWSTWSTAPSFVPIPRSYGFHIEVLVYGDNKLLCFLLFPGLLYIKLKDGIWTSHNLAS